MKENVLPGMQRILVIGCPGSGKSTFSGRLHSVMPQIPLYHLDLLYWNGDRTTVPREIFLDRLHQILQKPCWIIDGNYASTMELRLKAADTVFFLDYDTETCLSGVMERRGRKRPDLPWTEAEPDREFLEQVRGFAQRERIGILRLMEQYPEKTWIVFHGREEAEAFLMRRE